MHQYLPIRPLTSQYYFLFYFLVTPDGRISIWPYKLMLYWSSKLHETDIRWKFESLAYSKSLPNALVFFPLYCLVSLTNLYKYI